MRVKKMDRRSENGNVLAWLGDDSRMNIKKTLLEEKHNYATFLENFLGKNDKKNVKTTYGLPLLSAIFLPCLGYRRDCR